MKVDLEAPMLAVEDEEEEEEDEEAEEEEEEEGIKDARESEEGEDPPLSLSSSSSFSSVMNGRRSPAPSFSCVTGSRAWSEQIWPKDSAMPVNSRRSPE